MTERDLDLIDEIEDTRRMNNVSWMQFVRLAFEVAPGRARAILQEITDGDATILELARELARER